MLPKTSEKRKPLRQLLFEAKVGAGLVAWDNLGPLDATVLIASNKITNDVDQRMLLSVFGGGGGVTLHSLG